MISVRCPICDRPMAGAGPDKWPSFPFCSARCRLVDLGRWLGEEYAVQTKPEEEDSATSEGEQSIP
jgi:endogenous inhibitor of DNA gyrase (YacG/DUF329 family)